jgi:hypothetical protein
MAIDRGPRAATRVKHTKTGLSALAAVIALVAGCGTERPPPAGSSSGLGAGVGGGSGPGGFGDSGVGSKPPGCGQRDDGSFCDCIDVPLFADPPNMYFVLDRSGSMQEEDKWSQVRVVVAEILRGLGPRANFGATVFPGFEQSACAPAKEVLPISPGDPPGSTDGPTTKKLLATTAVAPNGGTPTAEALRAVLGSLQNVQGKTFVILATDGGPNCNTAASCGADQCMPNIENVPGCAVGGPSCCEPPNGFRESCLDSAPTLSAVTALKAAGIPVYVIGLPGATAYGTLLDQLAVSGGTALSTSPKYYKIASTSDNSALLKTLKQIAAKIVATCEFKLKEAPAQANQVNVYLDEIVLPKDPVNGWSIDGATVTLLGQACTKVLSGDVLDVRIITGCPTVEPR